MEHKRSDMLRSVIEGIAMNLNIILNVLKKDIEISEMILMGGMVNGAVQRQILADVFGMNVLKLNYLDEATSMGATITAGVGIGAFSGFHEIDKFVKIDEVCKPIKENVEKYKRIKPIFDKAYYALEDVYTDLAKL